jgi:copper chaperone CopZ
VTDLEPYLAAYGHLVALRAGDLAYLHVHPAGEPGDGKTPAGPDITFYATAPSTGDYRLFLDFQHDGVVRTAEFTGALRAPRVPRACRGGHPGTRVAARHQPRRSSDTADEPATTTTADGTATSRRPATALDPLPGDEHRTPPPTPTRSPRADRRQARLIEHSIELAIGGMTCASCANRIEKKLNKLDGVTATVNYATEKARVSYDGDVAPPTWCAAVEAAGLHRRAPPAQEALGSSGAPGRRRRRDRPGGRGRPTRPARLHVVVSAALGLPVVAMAMVPALQFTYWQWLSLTLAAPSSSGGPGPSTAPRDQPAPRHRDDGHPRLHGHVAAFACRSTRCSSAPPCPGDDAPLRADGSSRSDGAGTSTSRPPSSITTFILAGRYFEVRAKRRAGAALRALLELGRQGGFGPAGWGVRSASPSTG